MKVNVNGNLETLPLREQKIAFLANRESFAPEIRQLRALKSLLRGRKLTQWGDGQRSKSVRKRIANMKLIYLAIRVF